MHTLAWKSIKDVIGEDLSLFTVFMAELEARDILEGFVKMAKGASFISEDTMDAMYREMTSGIIRETLASKIPQSLLDLSQADDAVFLQAQDDLEDWLESSEDELTDNYIAYLTRWDLEGHSWIQEKPQSFSGFLQIQA